MKSLDLLDLCPTASHDTGLSFFDFFLFFFFGSTERNTSLALFLCPCACVETVFSGHLLLVIMGDFSIWRTIGSS